MLDKKILEHHHMQLVFHRILYGILVVFIFLLFCRDGGNLSAACGTIAGGTVLLMALELVLDKMNFFDRFWVIKSLTYIQYTFYLLMMYWIREKDPYLAVGMSALVLTFMFEYSYYSNITDREKSIVSILLLVAPSIGYILIQFCMSGVDVDMFFLLLTYGMLCTLDIFLVKMYAKNEEQLRRDIYQLHSDINDIEENNEELLDTKNRLEKVNDELNLQRVQLRQMNQQIRQSNDELEVQAQILKFINSSITADVSDILKYIIDVIMQVRNVEFCGIYIDKDVCYNKHPYVEFRSVSNPELAEVPELVWLYQEAKEAEDERTVISQFPSDIYPGLSRTETRQLVVLPLVMDDRKYGIIVSGSPKMHVFDNYIRFYDIIVPQLDLAIHNIRMYAQMQHIAQTDGLTGINNRTHFNKLFAEQMERTVRDHSPLTVALFDIDKFKRINDTYGHLVGDEVIKRIAGIAYEQIEASELGFICRYGGEEFVLALPGKTLEEALPVIEDLHRQIATATVEAYGHVVTMNVSIGVSTYPDLCADVNQLIKRADWSMYYAKEHGRGQIKVDGPDVTEE